MYVLRYSLIMLQVCISSSVLKCAFLGLTPDSPFNAQLQDFIGRVALRWEVLR